VTESVVLDNPVWEALNGRQAEFAIKGDGVLKYRPDVFIFAGIPDDASSTIEKVAELYKQGEIMGLMGFKLDIEPYFKRARVGFEHTFTSKVYIEFHNLLREWILLCM
jgi:hypothetical protein